MKVRIFSGSPGEVERDLNNLFESLINFNNVRKVMQSESSTADGLVHLTVTIFSEG